jgi:hypothetical protein
MAGLRPKVSASESIQLAFSYFYGSGFLFAIDHVLILPILRTSRTAMTKAISFSKKIVITVTRIQEGPFYGYKHACLEKR